MTRLIVRSIAAWPLRRWMIALLAGVGFGLVVAIPTDLIDTPYFSREIPPTWWAVPAVVASAVLVGLIAATYVDSPLAEGEKTRRGFAGSVLTFFAVGCPVCNKLVLVALGTSGALTWFEPLQPALQLLALALLGWALWARLRGEIRCRLRESTPDDHDLTTTTEGTARA